MTSIQPISESSSGFSAPTIPAKIVPGDSRCAVLEAVLGGEQWLQRGAGERFARLFLKELLRSAQDESDQRG
jgi:hypothetical protein